MCSARSAPSGPAPSSRGSGGWGSAVADRSPASRRPGRGGHRAASRSAAPSREGRPHPPRPQARAPPLQPGVRGLQRNSLAESSGTARPEAGAGPVETQRHFREALGHREDQALCYPRGGGAQPRAPERILKGRRQICRAGQSLRDALQSQFWGYFKGIHGAHGPWSGLGVGSGPRRRGREGLGPGPGRRRSPEGRAAHPPGRLRGGGGATCIY